MADIETRLEALEQANQRLLRENAWMKRVFALVLSFGTALLLMGQTPQPQQQQQEPAEEIVRAQRFELVDEQGNMMALLGVSDAGAVLSLQDNNGKLRGIFGVAQDNTAVFGLSDANAKPRVKINASATVAAINLLDAQGTNRAFLEAQDDVSALNLQDSNGKVRGLFSADKDQTTLSVRDPNENVRVMLGAKTADSSVGVVDSQGNPRVLLIASDAQQKMLLLNAQGKPAWQAP